MSITKTMGISLAMAFALTGGVGQAMAADLSCPEASSIKKDGETKDGDTAYKAAVGDQTWQGEVSQYDQALDLKGLTFAGAALVNRGQEHRVACDYKAADGNSLRMSLERPGAVTPGSDKAWNYVCNVTTREACTFK